MAEDSPELEDPAITASKAFDQAKNPEQKLAAITNLMGDPYLKDKGFGNAPTNVQTASEAQPVTASIEPSNSNQGILDKLSKVLPFLKKKPVQEPTQQTSHVPTSQPPARAA